MQKMQIVRTAVKFACAGAVLVLSGCSLFSSKKPSNPPAALVEFKPAVTVRTAWTASVGSAETYAFAPAVSGTSVYAAAADGTINRLNAATGASVWRINAGMKLTAGVGTDGFIVAVAGEKGA